MLKNLHNCAKIVSVKESNNPKIKYFIRSEKMKNIENYEQLKEFSDSKYIKQRVQAAKC